MSDDINDGDVQDAPGESGALVLEMDQVYSHKQVKRLRKGKGKLSRHLNELLEELEDNALLPQGVMPVVVIVRERAK